MNGKYIYPLVNIERLRYGKIIIIHFETYLRKTYKRKYYLWKFYKELEFKDEVDISEEIITALDRFHQEVYRTLILGKVDPKMILHRGGVCYPAFELDTDQTPERVRLIQNQLKGIK
jgi:hypothetical protein